MQKFLQSELYGYIFKGKMDIICKVELYSLKYYAGYGGDIAVVQKRTLDIEHNASFLENPIAAYAVPNFWKCDKQTGMVVSS